MLPAGARLQRSTDFRRVVRAGRRAGGRTLVVHATRGPGRTVAVGSVPPPGQAAGARVGLVVGRAVGGAVQRNGVRRRLRALLRERLPLLAGADVVVRALPPARGASSAELAAELDRLLPRALTPRGAA